MKVCNSILTMGSSSFEYLRIVIRKSGRVTLCKIRCLPPELAMSGCAIGSDATDCKKDELNSGNFV